MYYGSWKEPDKVSWYRGILVEKCIAYSEAKHRAGKIARLGVWSPIVHVRGRNPSVEEQYQFAIN